jgi:hypothetical protein
MATIRRGCARTGWGRSVRTTVGRVILFVSLPIVATGCQMTQSTFVQLTSEAGAEFAAAATTLQYAHEGKLTHPYARAAFESYASVLVGVDGQIRAAEGAPSPEMAQRLADLAREAEVVVVAPCLTQSCDWQEQVQLLRRASATLREASAG